MTPRRTALLALVLVATLGAAWATIVRFATARRAVERASGEERGAALLPFDPAGAEAIRIVPPTGPAGEVRLSRAGPAWQVTAPAPRPADRLEVDRLLDALAALRRRATSAPAGLAPELLRPYGLEAPRWRVEVRLAGGATQSLAVGGTTGEEGITFVMPTSGDVAMISTADRQALEEAAEALGAHVRGPAAPAPGEPTPARPGAAPARGR